MMRERMQKDCGEKRGNVSMKIASALLISQPHPTTPHTLSARQAGYSDHSANNAGGKIESGCDDKAGEANHDFVANRKSKDVDGQIRLQQSWCQSHSSLPWSDSSSLSSEPFASGREGKDDFNCQRKSINGSDKNPLGHGQNLLIRKPWHEQMLGHDGNSMKLTRYLLQNIGYPSECSTGSSFSQPSGLNRNLPSECQGNGGSKFYTGSVHTGIRQAQKGQLLHDTDGTSSHNKDGGLFHPPVHLKPQEKADRTSSHDEDSNLFHRPVHSTRHRQVSAEDQLPHSPEEEEETEEEDDMSGSEDSGPSSSLPALTSTALKKTECLDHKTAEGKEPMTSSSSVSVPTSSVKAVMSTGPGEQLHECPHCMSAFVDANNLKRHLSYTHGDKPAETKMGKGGVKCQDCGKMFSRPSRLERHRLTHTGQKPFVCEVCNKAFSQACNLKTHQILHTGRKPFVCDVCPKAFSDGANLKKHQVIHTGDKPFVCDVCDKGFVETGHLKRHRKIHTGQKPFVCDVCGKAFIEAGTLRRHKVQTNHNPIICFVCNRTFLLPEHLEKHRKVHAQPAVTTSEEMTDTKPLVIEF